MGGITSILILEWLDLLHVVCVLKVDLAMDGITMEPGGLEIYHPMLIEKTGNNEEISKFGSAKLEVLQFFLFIVECRIIPQFWGFQQEIQVAKHGIVDKIKATVLS